MDGFIRDIRHSVRVFLGTPGFTLTALAALTLGIGANTAVFSVVNTVLLRPVPFPDPDRIVLFMTTSPGGSGSSASPAKFNFFRAKTDAFEDVAAFRSNVANVTGGTTPEQVPVGQVSADFFTLFGAPIERGRTFSAEEDLPNGGHVAVLSDGLWRRRYGRDPSIVGRDIVLDGQPYTIVGVLGANFQSTGLVTYAAAPPDLWVPFQIDRTSDMQGNYFITAGKLKEGVTLDAAKAAMRLGADEFRREYPTGFRPQDGFDVRPIRDVPASVRRSSSWPARWGSCC